MTNENPRNARENNPLGNAISVMIFVAAVAFGGWYAYNQSVKVCRYRRPQRFDGGQYIVKHDNAVRTITAKNASTGQILIKGAASKYDCCQESATLPAERSISASVYRTSEPWALSSPVQRVSMKR